LPVTYYDDGTSSVDTSKVQFTPIQIPASTTTVKDPAGNLQTINLPAGTFGTTTNTAVVPVVPGYTSNVSTLPVTYKPDGTASIDTSKIQYTPIQIPASSTTVKDIIAEGLDVHNLVKNDQERDQRVRELLDMVNLNPEHMTRYPYEFSGGQRQRIGIARALAVDPQFIIADEPISALDVSIQAQVVNLMQDIQKKQGLTYLFIAHDLSMVKYISDRIAVMYRGKIVELAESNEIYNNPLHAYTQSLLSAIPVPDPEIEKQRTRIDFDHKSPFKDDQRLQEVLPGHFLYCSNEEAAKYKK